MAKDTIILHLDWQAFLSRLSNEQLGQWTRAVLHYMDTGEIPTITDQAVDVAFYAAVERISRDQAAWDRKLSGLKQYQKSESAEPHRKPPYGARTGGVPVPVPVPVPDPVSSSINDDSTDFAETTMTLSVEKLLKRCKDGGIKITPFAISQLIAAGKKMPIDLLEAIITNSVANGARSWAYIQKAIDKAVAQKLQSAQEYEIQHQHDKGNVVDRESPSGNDHLRRKGPLKLKQEG